MRILKSILIAFSLLLISNVGILAAADGAPTQYIAKDGTPKPCTLSEFPGVTPKNSEEQETQSDNSINLTDSNEVWLWAGQSDANEAATVKTAPEITGTGTVNIVVGPNGVGGSGGHAAMVVNGSLSIPDDVVVNIFQAANGLATGVPTANQCFLYFTGQLQDAEAKESKTPQPGITVQPGGELNVYSGVIVGTGSSAGTEEGSTAANGVLVNGTVEVGPYGTLEGDAASGTAGISINDQSNSTASVVSEGTLCSTSGANSTGILGSSIIAGTKNLTINNGVVFTSIPYDEAKNTATLNNGLWFTTNTTTALQTGTAFGPNPTYIYTAYKTSFGDGESLTILQGTTLTMANGAFTFGTEGSAQTTNTSAQLNVQGTLNIGLTGQSTVSSYFTSGAYSPADITMYSNSMLSNTGTINVVPTPTT